MIDIRSMFIVQFLVYMVCFLVLLQVWLKHKARYQGIEYWAAMMACHSIGLFLVFLRGEIAPLLSIVVGNIVILIGVTLCLFGLRRFFVVPGNPVFSVVVVFAELILMLYFTFVDPDIEARMIIVNIAAIAIYGKILWVLLRRLPREMMSITKALSWSVAALLAICLYRIVIIFLYPPVTQDFFQQNIFESSFLLLNNLATLYLVMNLTIMVSHRLLFEVKNEENKYNTIFYSSPYAVIMTRVADSKIIEINAEMLSLLGYTNEEIVGKLVADLYIWDDPSERERMMDILRQGRLVDNVETIFRRKDGRIVPTLFSSRIIKIAGVEYLLSTMKDITEINAMKEELLELATHDVLTKLPNRSLFVENFVMQQARASRSGEILGVAMIDFDDFKLINDKFGHDVGDSVLVSIAERLREFTRKGDHVARFGGDEFALLITGARGKAEIENAMKRLMDIMEPVVAVDQIGVKINVSIGVSLYPTDGTTHERLLKKADEALFEVKRSGKKAVKFAS